MTGALSERSGRAAEEAVAAHYRRRGATVAHRRWRGAGGEIDLVLREGATIVFVEVKHAHSLAAAAHRLGTRQAARLRAAAEEFLGHEPQGALTEMRFDVALVDRTGRIEVIANALDE